MAGFDDPLADGHPLRAEMQALLAGWDLECLPLPDPGYDAARWSGLLELWSRVTEPAGARVVLEEIGRARCPLPVQAGLVQVEAALAASGAAGEQHRAALLAGQRYAIGLHDAAGRVAPEHVSVRAERAADRWQLTGRVRYVPYADSAAVLLLPARVTPDAGGLLLVAVPADGPGVRCTTYDTLSGDRLSDLELAGVPVDLAGVLADGERATAALAAAVRHGRFGIGCELTGLAAALLARTVERVRSREAYGQPLSSLQAVQHRAADMYRDLVAASEASAEAAALLAGGSAVDGLDVVLAGTKLTTTGAAVRVVAGAHQLCGGWGQLAESELHYFTRAIKSLEGQLGTPTMLRAGIAAGLATR